MSLESVRAFFAEKAPDISVIESTTSSATVALAAVLWRPGLPDLIVPGLRLLFVGYNPSIPAAKLGHYYANPVNHFYRLLAESGTDRIAGYPDVPTYKELGWPVSVPIFYGIAGPAVMPAGAIAAWEALGQDLMTAPGYADLMGKLVSSASYKNSKDFTKAVVSSYREMGALVPKLGLKQN